MLALTAFINWDMLALGCVAGALWGWSTRRPTWTGVFVGLGTAAKLYPLFLIGPLLVLCLRERKLDAWTKTIAAALVAWLAVDVPVYLASPTEFLWFWRFNTHRGADLGSLWLLAGMYGDTASSQSINITSWLVFGAVCLLIGLLGLLAPRRPRLAQLAFLVVAAFLLVNKVYSPQYVLWLLPLAAFARPRWRDLAVWQACELFYFFAVWMHLANFFVTPGPCRISSHLISPAGCDWVYSLAILIRVTGQLYLIVLVVRDIFDPSRDPVRSDGLSDDPLGGILDTGIDSDPYPQTTTTSRWATPPDQTRCYAALAPRARTKPACAGSGLRGESTGAASTASATWRQNPLTSTRLSGVACSQPPAGACCTRPPTSASGPSARR